MILTITFRQPCGKIMKTQPVLCFYLVNNEPLVCLAVCIVHVLHFIYLSTCSTDVSACACVCAFTSNVSGGEKVRWISILSV